MFNQGKRTLPRLGGSCSYLAATVLVLVLYVSADASSESPDSEKPLAQPTMDVVVHNSALLPQKLALVDGGFPLFRGAVTDVAMLELSDKDGKKPPFQARPLTYWPGGSVKWVELTFYLEQLAPDERRVLAVRQHGAVSAAVEHETPSQPFDPSSFRLADASGAHSLVVRNTTLRYSGCICAEMCYEGYFMGREDRTTGAISVTTFPGIAAVRYRVELKQLANGDMWTGLDFLVPHGNVYVHRLKEMGAELAKTEDGRVRVTLIKTGVEPVDKGIGCRWEIWGYDDPSRFLERPLRPQCSPQYLQATATLGSLAIEVPEEWARSFQESCEAVFAARDANSRNFGWRHYGNFFDRSPKTGLAYYGYVNQEYDPATALVLAYARTGDLSYLAHAEDLADQFRDMCISPEGGVYQHRATIHAADAHIISIMTKSLMQRIKSHPSFGLSAESLGDVVTDLYGKKYGDLHGPVQQVLEAVRTKPFDEQLGYFTDVFAAAMLDDVVETMTKKLARLTPEELERLPGSPAKDIRGWFQTIVGDETLRDLGYTDVDKDFEPFFQRYGGAWSDFPAFEVDLRPDRKKHEGGHSLVEMLVWTYCLTGDEGLRDVALLEARHQLDVICPYVLEQNKGIVDHDKFIHTRPLSWPLIGLLSVWELTEKRDHALHIEIQDMAKKLAYQLAANAPDQHEGGIHAGIGMESLARYHEKTHDDHIAEYLVKWARYWAETQWEPGRGFRYARDKEGTGDFSMTALILYGLAYAHDLAPDDALKRRVLSGRDLLLEKGSGSYSKSFGMAYRSTPRALEIINRWSENGAQR